jgi:hypothetical protein
VRYLRPSDHEPEACFVSFSRRLSPHSSWRAALALGLLACGGEESRPAAWEDIAPVIFKPSCATVSCHSRAAAAAGLDFSSPARGYTSLTGLWTWIVDDDAKGPGCMAAHDTVVCERRSRPLVVPWNPAQSRLVAVLKARNAIRMPPDRPLPAADVALVERWILEGARETVDGPPAGGMLEDAGPPLDARPRDDAEGTP